MPHYANAMIPNKSSNGFVTDAYIAISVFDRSLYTPRLKFWLMPNLVM